MKYPCQKCPREFHTQGGLNGHQRAHSFWTALSKIPNQTERQKEREELNTKIVVTAIHHYTINARPAKMLGAAPHCDVCAVVSGVDDLLIRDLNTWLFQKPVKVVKTEVENGITEEDIAETRSPTHWPEER